MTGWLIAINVAVHVVLELMPARLANHIVNYFGFLPDSLHQPLGMMTMATLFTYQFLHGSWDHLGMNMITLLAFGAGVERPLGRARFLVIYFVSGIAGALLQSAFSRPDDLMIGASASISGIFGALLIIWGFDKQGRRPLGILPMVLLWSVVMAASGVLGIGADGVPVAWIAHIGGFVAGVVIALLFERVPRRRWR